ncbi:GL17683 [Drosophila persimilis]|uniref:GL17683 n=1 Tax=Drosophila persimilis TaxID=7234 RepID=B4GIB3_DROPE|nr:GL17683 [Drosophila persimilis]
MSGKVKRPTLSASVPLCRSFFYFFPGGTIIWLCLCLCLVFCSVSAQDTYSA